MWVKIYCCVGRWPELHEIALGAARRGVVVLAAIEQQMLWYSYEPSPGDVASGQKAVDDVLTWSNSQHWGGFSATLLNPLPQGGKLLARKLVPAVPNPDLPILVRARA